MTTGRRWRLRGYPSKRKDDKPAVEKICDGDPALNTAIHQLEADPAIVRITAEFLR